MKEAKSNKYKPVKLLCLLFHGSIQDLSLECNMYDLKTFYSKLYERYLIQLLSHVSSIC